MLDFSKQTMPLLQCERSLSLNHVCVFVQVDKVVQLYETMMTRHTTMVVGPTGGGKSVVIKTLAESQTK